MNGNAAFFLMVGCLFSFQRRHYEKSFLHPHKWTLRREGIGWHQGRAFFSSHFRFHWRLETEYSYQKQGVMCFHLSSYLKLSVMMMMMWLVLSPPSHLQLIAKGRIDECGVKRNSPKGRLALNTVIGFHRIIPIFVAIIVHFILHILHIARRGEWTHVVRIKSGSWRRGPPHRKFNPKYEPLQVGVMVIR